MKHRKETEQAVAQLKFPDKQETFTHVDNDTGKSRSFLIETMQHFVTDYPACADLIYQWLPIDKKVSDYMRTNQGIEQARLDRLCDPYLSAPLLAVLWPEGELTIVDGSHRVVKNFEMGEKKLKCVIFKYPFWENFLLPEEVSDKLVRDGCLTSDSGILAHEAKMRSGT